MTIAASLIGAPAPLDWLAIGAGLVAFLVVLALAAGLSRRDPLAARIQALALPADARGAIGPGAKAEAKAGAFQFMRGAVERLNLMRSRQAERVVDKLANAGWRSKDALVVYLFAKLALPLAAGGAGAGALFLLATLEAGLLPRLVLVLAGVLGASYLPDLMIRRRAAARRRAITRSLPDALDLLVICAEAGLSLDAGLERIARELARSAPALADELALTTFELGFLPERRTALDNLCRRTGIPAVRSLASTLQQTEKFGTPLAASLRVIAAELRNTRMLAAEEKAARLPVVMTVPLIVFVMPALFVVVMGPGVLDIIDAFTRL